MAETKSLCAKISVELHNKVTQSKDESGLTLNEYVKQLITEYYQMKERTPNMATRTLALQCFFLLSFVKAANNKVRAIPS